MSIYCYRGYRGSLLSLINNQHTMLTTPDTCQSIVEKVLYSVCQSDKPNQQILTIPDTVVEILYSV